MADVTLYTNTAYVPTGVSVLVSDEFDLGGYTAADTFNVMKLPAGCMVLGACIEITEASGETCTVDVGITGTDVDEWIDGADMEGAAGTYAGTVQGDGITSPVITTAATVVTVLTVTGSTYAAGKGKVHMIVAKF